jgi:chromosomal replication initiation ATPase DnaA
MRFTPRHELPGTTSCLDHTVFRTNVPHFPAVDFQHLDSLTRELQTIASLPRSVSPTLVGLCRQSLAALSGIPRAVTIAQVIEGVRHEFHVVPAQLRSRSQHLSFARHVRIYLARKITGAPFEIIGRHFGRDHSTAVYAFNLIERRITTDAAFRRNIEKIEARITNAATVTAPAA